MCSLSHGCASGQVSIDFSVRGRIFAHSEQALMNFSTSFPTPGHQDFRFTMFLVAWTPECVSWARSVTSTSQHQIFDKKFDQKPESVRIKMADLAGR